MYYSEFDACLLFNLEEDPDEVDDRSEDPVCRHVRDGLLARLKARWSADRMLDGEARHLRALRVLQSCGHPLILSDPPPPEVPEDANEFDFSQVPDWEAIRKRAEAGLK
jgi:hypothetical protein